MWYFNPGDCNTAILYILYHQSRHGEVKKWRGGTNHKRCSRCPGFFMVSRFHTGRANRKGSSTANKTAGIPSAVCFLMEGPDARAYSAKYKPKK